MNRIDKQLKKGVLDILILSLLSKNDRMYGYEIIKILKHESRDYYALKEGSLYPVLYRLEDKGFIKNEIIYSQTKRGVPRKYYSITESGKHMLQNYLEAWDLFIRATNNILQEQEGAI